MAKSKQGGWSLIPSRGEVFFVMAVCLGFILTAPIMIDESADYPRSQPGLLLFIIRFYRALIPVESISPLLANTLILSIVSAVLGFLEPRHAWRWGFAGGFLGPAICFIWWAIFMHFGDELSLGWDLFLLTGGILQMGVWIVPAVAAGYLGARIRIRHDRGGGDDPYSPGRYRKRKY